MIKTIGLLMAVSLTPAYATYYSLGEEGPTQIDEFATYYFSYVLNDDQTEGGFIGNAWDNQNPTPYPLDYVCKIEIDEFIISSNYYSSLTCDITFNQDYVIRFNACSLVIKYGDTSLISATYSVASFDYNTNQFGFNYYVRTNNEWSNAVTYNGSTMTFSTENDDIDQDGFFLYFYAYERDKQLITQDAFDDGYDAGYDVGRSDGLKGADFNMNWILNSVGGFLDTKIFGSFGIGDLLTLILGVFIMIYLLKVFAGG